MEFAFAGVLENPLPGRLEKPRRRGLTMVIDKGLSLGQTNDWLRLVGPHLDLLKLGFGTGYLYGRRTLEQKIAACAEAGVTAYPGGTFFEAAQLQGKGEAFLERCWQLGFRVIEVSDGTIELSAHQRRRWIERARQLGFTVVTEVGKKSAFVPVTALVEQALADLAAGAAHVIVEGREGGVGVGLYDSQGKVKASDLEALVSGVGGIEQLLFEAPQKAQQEFFLRHFGPAVNLGNIAVDEVLAVESLRRGLRSDTLRWTLPQAAAVGHNGGN